MHRGLRRMIVGIIPLAANELVVFLAQHALTDAKFNGAAIVSPIAVAVSGAYCSGSRSSAKALAAHQRSQPALAEQQQYRTGIDDGAIAISTRSTVSVAEHRQLRQIGARKLGGNQSAAPAPRRWRQISPAPAQAPLSNSRYPARTAKPSTSNRLIQAPVAVASARPTCAAIPSARLSAPGFTASPLNEALTGVAVSLRA